MQPFDRQDGDSIDLRAHRLVYRLDQVLIQALQGLHHDSIIGVDLTRAWEGDATGAPELQQGRGHLGSQ